MMERQEYISKKEPRIQGFFFVKKEFLIII